MMVKVIPSGIKDHFSYCSDTGNLFRLNGKGTKYGPVLALCVNKLGYVVVKYEGVQFLAHRVSWYLYHKVQPPSSIDHVNGVRDDNRAVNLRACTLSQNAANQIGSRGVSLFKGVHYIKVNELWGVRVGVKGVRIALGCYTCEREAALAYNYAAQKHFGEFANYNQVFEDNVYG